MKKICIIGFLIIVHISTASAMSIPLTLSSHDVMTIGKKIWYNESCCSVDKLVWWNAGEEFASLGIGHFIWFPAHYKGPFTETFPELLIFLRDHGVVLPSWLVTIPPCPWQSRQAFFEARKTAPMYALQTLLAHTVELQARFIIQRLVNALPTLTKDLSMPLRKRVQHNFTLMTRTPQGMYALIDYTHFKGEGINTLERYKNQGWGLVQILEKMRGNLNKISPLQEFVAVAQELLTLRVRNAPPERNEHVWLPGWCNRVQGYLRV